MWVGVYARYRYACELVSITFREIARCAVITARVPAPAPAMHSCMLLHRTFR